ncbi:MAG: hypothetical protein H7Z39_18025, partial [Burkholderiaceae bacterium]|nr:hypothetical protein [Burkholderiaceae bacterium]
MHVFMHWLERQKFGPRLLVCIGSGLAVALAVGLIGISTLGTLSATVQRIQEEDLGALADLRSAQVNLAKVERRMRAAAKQPALEAAAMFRRDLAGVRGRGADAEIERLLDDAERGFASYVADATNPLNPYVHTPFARWMAASAELFERATRRYGKPRFDLSTQVAGKSIPVGERVLWSKP